MIESTIRKSQYKTLVTNEDSENILICVPAATAQAQAQAQAAHTTPDSSAPSLLCSLNVGKGSVHEERKGPDQSWD